MTLKVHKKKAKLPSKPTANPPSRRASVRKRAKVVRKDRLQIYYLVGKNKALYPTSGCSVNELNFIKSLSKFADVYYNNHYFDTLSSEIY